MHIHGVWAKTEQRQVSDMIVVKSKACTTNTKLWRVKVNRHAPTATLAYHEDEQADTTA